MSLVAGIDLETTGLSQKDGHRIIEIAISIHNDETGELKGTYVKRINPERSIDPKAQRIHGISFEELSGEKTIEELAPAIIKVLGACPKLVAHNGLWFDLPFLKGELNRVGLVMPEVTVVDTMKDARWATPMGKLPKLQELCFACGVEYDLSKAHGALYDVDVMMECYFKAKGEGYFK
jgi:DNA polymerase-3 subunit epsilon